MMAESKIKHIYDLLDLIRQRPALYLGSSSLDALSHFIHGYFLGRDTSNTDSTVSEEPPFRHFTPWLGRGFRRDGGGASYTRILTSEALFVDWDEDKAAFEMFFEFLDEFRRRSSHVRAFIEFESLKKSKFSRECNSDSTVPLEVPLTTEKVAVVEYVCKKGEDVWMRHKYKNFSPAPEFYLTYSYTDQFGKLHTNDGWFNSLEDALERGSEEFDFELSDWTLC